MIPIIVPFTFAEIAAMDDFWDDDPDSDFYDDDDFDDDF